MQQQRDNSGALFRNTKREKPSQPEFRGDVLVDGRKFWVSAWVKEGKNGKFFSLALTPADEAPRQDEEPRRSYAAPPSHRSAPPPPPAQRAQPPPRKSFEQALDDEIPF